MFDCASAWARAERTELALSGVEHVLEIAPKRASVYRDTYELARELGEGALATEVLERAAARHPNTPWITRALAWRLATASDPARRDPERAIALLSGSSQAVPNDFRALDTLAAALKNI